MTGRASTSRAATHRYDATVRTVKYWHQAPDKRQDVEIVTARLDYANGAIPRRYERRRSDSSWWQWSRPYENGHIAHSAKPDAFLDLVEQVSPEPRVELFARKQRLGWDTWGDQALDHVGRSMDTNPSEVA